MGDSVVLRSNPRLIGGISRTYYDYTTHESLEDLLIIAHAPVPPAAYQSFVPDGAPPKGYVFVEWARKEHGHSLVAYHDLDVVARRFNIGDTVKDVVGESPVVGTIIDVHDTYILEPIVRIRHGVLDFKQDGEALTTSVSTPPVPFDRLPEAVAHPRPQELLYNIPAEELKRAEDFLEGDYVLRKDWIGVMEDLDLEVVLLLENNTLVVVQESQELELVIPDTDKPLITLPDLDGIRRPDVLETHAGGMMSTPCHQLSRGQFVITNHRNLRNGRWLHGSYQDGCKPQGRILDIRTSHVDVQWLCPNAFATEWAGSCAPSSHIRPYENLSAFNIPTELRRNKSLVPYDRFRYPARRSSDQDGTKPISAGQDFDVGDSVRFRDPTAAAVKYQSPDNGRFERIPKGSTYGFDLNEFRIFSARQEVVVQWQNQSNTTQNSITLRPYSLPEAELCPGDLVTLKEGMQQIEISADKPDKTVEPFNEMLYFQGSFRLRPSKIGVIQSVDSKERLARIRLFANPSVELLEQGHVLGAGSRLGPISDKVEEVSLYEIMSHAALVRRRRDLVIIPPKHPYSDVLQSLKGGTTSCALGPSTLSYLRSVRLDSKWAHLSNIAKHFVQQCGPLEPGAPYDGKRIGQLDWIGQIVDVGIDGLLTVRLGGLGLECHDIRLPFEQILMVLDEDAQLDDGSSIMSTEEPPGDQALTESEYDSESVIDEEVEYEGGERLDDDSDSDWMTDEDMEERVVAEVPAIEQDQVMEDVSAAEPSGHQQQSTNCSSPHSVLITTDPTLLRGLKQLLPFVGAEEPASFSILDITPTDHFAIDKPQASTAAFLRRVNREHRILSTSLPANEVYVRTYESRLDLLRCLIIGPADTPYEFCPFVIDLHLGPNFPTEPPAAHFHSWTGGLGRINPNLYEEGKICLSLLNTWPGQSAGESWSDKASLLQVLISLMGLVLVNQPFYNEAGFEAYGEEKIYTLESQQYSEKAFVLARGFVKHALTNPVKGLEDVLTWTYLPSAEPSSPIGNNRGLLAKVVQRGKLIIDRSAVLRNDEKALVNGAGETGDSTEAFLKPLSKGAVAMLSKTINALEELATMTDDAMTA